MFWIGLVVGLVVGMFLGILLVSLLISTEETPNDVSCRDKE